VDSCRWPFVFLPLFSFQELPVIPSFSFFFFLPSNALSPAKVRQFPPSPFSHRLIFLPLFLFFFAPIGWLGDKDSLVRDPKRLLPPHPPPPPPPLFFSVFPLPSLEGVKKYKRRRLMKKEFRCPPLPLLPSSPFEEPFFSPFFFFLLRIRSRR